MPAQPKPLSGARARRPFPLVVALGLSLLAAGCGDDETDVIDGPPDGDTGLPAETISEAISTIDFARFVTHVTAWSWDHDRRLDAAWRFNEASMTWDRTDLGRQTIYTGDGQGHATEIRYETEIVFRVRYFLGDSPRMEMTSADRARLDLTIRRRHYALDPEWPIEKPYDLTGTFAAAFRITDGSADTLLVCGQLTGWVEQPVDGVMTRLQFEGPIEIGFDFPGHFESCPSEYMTADFVIRDENGIELDRYSGSFAAGAGESLYTGALVSERGPGSFGINLDRGCDTPGWVSPAGILFPATRPGQ